MMKYLSLLAFVVTVAGCAETVPTGEEFVTEADISEANRNQVCPVDVSEADRALYPACN